MSYCGVTMRCRDRSLTAPRTSTAAGPLGHPGCDRATTASLPAHPHLRRSSDGRSRPTSSPAVGRFDVGRGMLHSNGDR